MPARRAREQKAFALTQASWWQPDMCLGTARRLHISAGYVLQPASRVDRASTVAAAACFPVMASSRPELSPFARDPGRGCPVAVCLPGSCKRPPVPRVVRLRNRFQPEWHPPSYWLAICAFPGLTDRGRAGPLRGSCRLPDSSADFSSSKHLCFWPDSQVCHAQVCRSGGKGRNFTMARDDDQGIRFWLPCGIKCSFRLHLILY